MGRTLKNQWENLETIDQTHPKFDKKSPKNCPKIDQKPSKIRKKSLQKLPETNLGTWSVQGPSPGGPPETPGQIFGWFWAPSWTQPGPRWLPKMTLKSSEHRCQNRSKIQAFGEGGKAAPDVPKTAPRRPQGAPRYSKNAKIKPKWKQVRTKIDSKAH